MFTKKETIKSLTKAFYDWRVAAKDYMHTLKFPATRNLLSINATDDQGRLNGMAVVEMLTIVNLTEGTGEKVELISSGKDLVFRAVKKFPITPEVLR